MRWLRRALWAAVWAAVSIAALVGSAIYHAQLPVARRIVRDVVNNFVSGEVRGELAIGRLDHVDLDHVVARHVTLYDGEGRRVIVADRVDLYPDFGALRSNKLRFRVSRLTNGTVRLIDDGTGAPSWISGLNPTVPGSGGGDPLGAQLDRIELVDVTVYGDYLGLQDMRVEDVSAVGRLDIKHTVEVRIDSASGTFVRPFEFLGRVDGVRGAISTNPLRGVSLQMDGHREAARGTGIPETPDRLHARVTYRSTAALLDPELRLELEARDLTPETLRMVGYTWIGPIDAPLNGRVRLYGPPASLTIDADIDSQAGSALVNGSLSAARGVSVQVRTDGLALDQLVSDMPSLTLRGSLKVAAGGPDDDPRLRVVLGPMRYKGLLVPAFEAEGVIRDDRLYIERARATQTGRLSLQGMVSFDGGTDLRIDAHLPAVQRDPNVSRYVENLEGALTAAVRIRIPRGAAAIDIDGQVQLEQLRYTSLSAARVVISGSARGDPALPKLDVEVHGEDVRLQDYSLGSAHFALRGGPRNYAAQGEFSPAVGQKTFYFDAQVAATKKQFVVQADPIELVVGDKTFRGLARDLTVVNGKSVSLGLLRLASGPQRLEARGSVQFKGETQLRADLQNFDLAAVRALLGERFPLSEGNADATVELRGPITHPQVLLQGAMRGARVLGVPNVGSMFFLTYADGHLELENEIEVGGRGALHLSGSGELDATIADPRVALERGRYELQLAADAFDLTLLAPLAQTFANGRVSGTVSARGTLDAPRAQGRLSASELILRGMAPIDGRAEFDYDAAALSAKLSVADGAGDLAQAQLRARLPWEQLRSEPALAIKSAPAGDWELIGETRARAFDQLPFVVPAALKLPMAVSSKFELTRQNLDNRGRIDLRASTVERLRDRACRLRASSQVQASLGVNGESLTVAFEGQLEGKPVMKGQGQLELPLSAWLSGERELTITRADLNGKADFDDIEKVPVLCQHGRGDLHANMRLEALFTPEQRAQLDLFGSLNPHVRVLEGRQRRVIESCRDDPARVWLETKLDAKSLDANGWMEGCYGGHTDVKASMPLRWVDGAQLPERDTAGETRIQVDFGESQLRPLLDRVPGVLGFGATASGQLIARSKNGQVSYSGEVRVTDGNLYMLASGQDLTRLRGVFTGNGSWIKIAGLEATAAQGKLEAAGGIGFEGFTPARLQLGVVLRNFTLQREGLALATLNGSAALSTEIKSRAAQTAVKIHELSIQLPTETSRSLQTLDPHPDVLVTTDKPKKPPDAPYALEFFVDGQRGVNARRDDFNVQLAVELAVSFQDPVLHVGGYVEFIRGDFEVFGKQFDVNRGSLQFDGGTELNPEIHLVATQRPEAAGADRVAAQVTGTLTAPVVEFFSETCPGQGAVVQLVSGRCPSEEDEASTDAASAQSAFTAGVLGGVLTLGARRGFGGILPTIAVESTGEGSQTRVKAGFEAVPSFMRPLVQRVYLQGALSTSDDDAEGTSASSDTTTADFLIELYFPHNIVGTARMVPASRSWGLDVTWEP